VCLYGRGAEGTARREGSRPEGGRRIRKRSHGASISGDGSWKANEEAAPEGSGRRETIKRVQPLRTRDGRRLAWGGGPSSFAFSRPVPQSFLPDR